MRRPALADVGVRAVARRPVGDGVRHRLRHFRDGCREAHEQADRDDERHGEERVLDGGLASRHTVTLRGQMSHVCGEA
jgi:hypothetical protein